MFADKLRKSLLQAAIQGRLTEHLPTDGDARDLLKKIRDEKAKLIKAKKIKAEKPLPPVTDDEIPFDLPANWCWCRLGEVCQINPRNKPKDENIDATFLPMTSINEGYGSGYNPLVRPWTEIKSGFTHFADGDVILAKITPCFQNRKSALVSGLKNGIGAGTTELYVFRSYGKHVDGKYLLYFVKNQQFISDGLATMKGTAGQQRVSRDFIANYLLPMPPLAEQLRIVERLNELLSEVAELEKDERELNLHVKNFPRKMKNSLLQAAIQGQLTEQLPTDGDARYLLKKIRDEKAQLIKAKKIKAEKPLPSVTDDEIPFDLPANWCWCRLGDIGTWGAGATPLKGNPAFYENATIPWLVTGDLNDGLITNVPRKISALALEKTSVKLNPIDSVLVAMYGATIGKIGMLTFPATTNQACCACQTFEDIEPWYLMFFLMFQRRNFIKQGVGGAQPNISKEKIISTLFPLPPLAEQLRIVERLNELLPLCEI